MIDSTEPFRGRIHRGTQQIGGTCIELEVSGTRILLDLGLPLDAAAPFVSNFFVPEVSFELNDRKPLQIGPFSIREPFLSSEEDHGALVVHGHTPTRSREPDLRANRLNIDTGACFGGLLTAAAFSDEQGAPLFFVRDSGEISMPSGTFWRRYTPRKHQHMNEQPDQIGALPSPPAEAPQWPVTILPNGGGKPWLAQGIYDLLMIDRARLTNAIHRRIYDATCTGIPYHDHEGAKAAMESWAFPRIWLDFETITFADSRWVGTRSRQPIPFQFSAHIEHTNKHIDHREFINIDGTDPRRACAEALVTMIPPSGTVIAYNASFERSCINGLANAFPDLEIQLRAIADRVVDLLPIARANWYHRDQRGSWSIKAVLPTVSPELNYADLEVQSGQSVQKFYLEAIAANTEETRRHAISVALRAYCKLDTKAMMAVASALLGQKMAM